MTFPEALMWLVQNPTGVVVRAGKRMLGLSGRGALYEFTGVKPDYARVWINDIVAADWETLSQEALAALTAQNQAGQ